MKYKSKLTNFLVELDNENGEIDEVFLIDVMKELLSLKHKHYEYALKLIADIYPYRIGKHS